MLELDVPFDEPAARILSVPLGEGRLERLISGLAGCLSESERRDTRSLLLDSGSMPSLEQIMDTQPLSALMASVQERWLFEMIQEGRLATVFQPIVRMDDPTEVYGYECLLRGKMPDGATVSPDRMYGAARDAELLFQLDRAARLAAIRQAMIHKIETRLFINFNPSSIYDPNFCLKSTIEAIDAAGIDPDRIVFEVVESDRIDVDLTGIMRSYRKAGFRVALDDLGAGYGSLNLLGSLRPDIVKLDMRLARDVDRDPYKAGITSKLLEMARKLQITTIAEGIETPGEFHWFLDHGANLVQGYLIARPASPPPLPSREILDGQVEAAPARSTS